MIRQGGQGTDPCGHGIDAIVVQQQPVQHPFGKVPPGRLHIGGVFPENVRPVLLQPVCHG